MGRFLYAILWTMLAAIERHYSSAIEGQNPSAQALPRSKRLYRRTNPSPSQYNALIRSFRFPQKRNRLRLNGSRENSSFTSSAKPSMPFLKSVYPQATYICSACEKSFSMRLPGAAIQFPPSAGPLRWESRSLRLTFVP